MQTELPQARWQRCVAHFERNVLSQVPAADMAEVAADLKGIFAVYRRESADALVTAFAERHRRRFPRAVATLETGITDALTFLAFPTCHQRLLRTINGLERLFSEAKRRTRVIGIFTNLKSTDNLRTAVLLRATEEWALKRYLDMQPLNAMSRKAEGNQHKK